MTRARDTITKRTAPHGAGDGVALPLFAFEQLDQVRRERDELRHKIAHQRLDVRSRIRTEQKVALLTAKILRLEMQIGRPN
jgi:uncharacterized small protein (DUF1192 family)